MIRTRTRGGGQWFVAVLPGQWTAERVRALAQATARVPLEADQLLRRPTPHVVTFADEREARAFRAKLEGVGIKSVIWDQSVLDAVPDARIPEAATFHTAAASNAYRDAPARVDIRYTDGAETSFGRHEIRLVVTAKLAVAWRDEEDELNEPVPVGLRPPPMPRRVHVVVPRREDRWVVDLYGATREPLRIIERTTRLEGLGTLRFERRAAILRLRRWLTEAEPPIAIQEGYLPIGLPIDPTPPNITRDDSLGWDSWSSAAWVIHLGGAGVAPFGG